MFTSFGKFTRYTREVDPLEYGGSNPIFIRNEAGQDFYELRATLYEANGPVFVRSDYDAFFTTVNGVVSVVSSDPSRIFPQDVEFWGYQGPDAAGIVPGILFDGETLSPAPPPPYIPIELPKAVLFDRMNDDEYDALADSVDGGETRRVREIYRNTSTFIEGSPMWELLVKHLTLTVTAERMALLLTRPGQGAATADEAGEVVPA